MQGRIQDLGLGGGGGGAWVGEGSGDRLRFPIGSRTEPWYGAQGGETPPKLWGFEELHTFI